MTYSASQVTLDDLMARIARLEAVRKAAERMDTYLRVGGLSYCDICLTADELHEDDCPVPALRATLDAAKATP